MSLHKDFKIITESFEGVWHNAVQESRSEFHSFNQSVNTLVGSCCGAHGELETKKHVCFINSKLQQNESLFTSTHLDGSSTFPENELLLLFWVCTMKENPAGTHWVNLMKTFTLT